MDSQASPMMGAYKSYKGSNSIIEMHTKLVGSVSELRDSVLDANWKKVKIQAASSLGLADGARRLLEIEGEVHNDNFGASVNNATNIIAILKEIFTSGNDELIDVFVNSFKDNFVDFPNKLAEIEEEIVKFKNGEVDNLTALLSAIGPNSTIPEPVQHKLVREMTLACASRGLLGLIHADFNLSLASSESVVNDLDDFDSLSDMQHLYTEYSNGLKECKQKLHAAMQAQDAKGASLEAAGDVLYFIERKLPIFARAQAWMHLFAQRLLNEGKGGAAEKIGRVAAKSGKITRESVGVHVSCLRIILELAANVVSDNVDTLIKEASNLSYDSNLPNGTDVELSMLDQSSDGDFVEISGFVTEHVAFKTQDQKLISKLKIHDPSSDTTAFAAAIFTQLSHTGVTKGSFCRITGVYKESSEFLESESGVEIDRLSLAEIAKNDWSIALLRLSDRWYQAWRNGTNMVWGLGPQFVIGDIDGALDEGASSFGAGELIFPPLIREQ